MLTKDNHVIRLKRTSESFINAVEETENKYIEEMNEKDNHIKKLLTYLNDVLTQNYSEETSHRIMITSSQVLESKTEG